MDTARPVWFLPTLDTINSASGDALDDLIGKLQLSYPIIEGMHRRHSVAGNLATDENKRTFAYNVVNLPEVQQEYQRLKAEYDARDQDDEKEQQTISYISEMKNGKCLVRRQNFAEIIIDEFHPICFNNNLWIYAEGVYQRDCGQIRSFIVSWIKRFAPYEFSGSLRNEIVELTQYVKGECNVGSQYPFDKERYKIAVQNGVLFLNPYNGYEVELLPHSPEFKFTTILPIRYDSDVDGDVIQSVLSDWLPGGEVYLRQQAALPFYQRWRAVAKIAFIIEGSKDSGKTSWLQLLDRMYGSSVSHVSLNRICSDRFAFSQMESKLLNSYDELPVVPLDGYDRFKQITGGTAAVIERKGENAYDARLDCLHIFSCNYPPKLKGDDDAFFSRWVYQIFPNSFDRDESYMERLLTEANLSAFLNIILAELRGLLSGSIGIARMDADEVAGIWKLKSDEVAQFVNDVCEMDPEGRVQKDDLVRAYIVWCREQQPQVAVLEKVGLSKRLSRLGIVGRRISVHGKQIEHYTGVKLKTNIAPKKEGIEEW